MYVLIYQISQYIVLLYDCKVHCHAIDLTMATKMSCREYSLNQNMKKHNNQSRMDGIPYVPNNLVQRNMKDEFNSNYDRMNTHKLYQ